MDFLGGFFLVTFILIIFYSNFIFFKELKKTEKKHFKHKLFYLLISIFFPCFIVFIIAAILTSPALIEMSDLKINISNNINRLIFGSSILITSILINLYIAKFYLKRISNTKKENEIELIGKE